MKSNANVKLDKNKKELKMIKKILHTASTVALCIAFANPTLSTAASSSVTLSNINITSSGETYWDKEALANYMELMRHSLSIGYIY